MTIEYHSLTFVLPPPPDPSPDGTLLRRPPSPRRLDVKCVDESDVDALLGNLIGGGHIPAETHRVSYVLRDEATGRRLPKGRSLVQLGVAQGATVRVLRVHKAGPFRTGAQGTADVRGRTAW